MESGQAGRNISMMPPNIQPYQASSRGAASSGNSKASRDAWQKNAAIAAAIWVGGWFLGYGVLWPLSLTLQALSGILSFTPFGSMLDWFTRTGPAPDLFPTANELRIPNSQVGRYMESYVQSYGDAALIFAAHDGYSQLVTGLLLNKELGYADLIDAADESGHTALLYAAGRGFPQVAAALLQNGADPDAPKQGKDGRGLTPLMEAAGTGHRDIVTLLLKANATVDQLDEQGNTALMYAAGNGNLGVLQELLQRGAMRDTANRRGDSALSMATANGHQAIVDALQRGARPVVEKRGRGTQSNVRLPEVNGRKAKEKETRPKATAPAEPAEEEKPEEKKPAKAPPKDPASSLASWFSKIEETDAASASTPGDNKRIKELEKQLEELKRTHEAADLKSQRRIVELLEASSSKQKLVDQADQERKDFENKLEELKKKLRVKEAQSEEDDERSSKLSREAHEARMEVEKERTRAESAERERDRIATDLKRLEATAKQRSEEQEQQEKQVERLKARVKALREEADHAEEERRSMQAKVDEMRATHPPEHDSGSRLHSSTDPPAESPTQEPGSSTEKVAEQTGAASPPPAELEV